MKSTPLFKVLLLLAIAYGTSCNKISESIQRDVIVTDTVLFDIPVLSSTTTATTIPKISSTINLAEEIHKQVSNFDIANVSSVKLKSLNMDLDTVAKDSVDTRNNFGNLETVRFYIAAGATTEEIANASVSSPAILSILALSPVIPSDVLKPYITNVSSHYNVLVKAKTATTTIMKVKATATYSVTLSK